VDVLSDGVQWRTLLDSGNLLQARPYTREREFFIDNLLVQIHLIVEMILLDRPCAMGV